jgi:hypothetical protein
LSAKDGVLLKWSTDKGTNENEGREEGESRIYHNSILENITVKF